MYNSGKVKSPETLRKSIREKLEIHILSVYNMLRAVMILHTIVRKSMIKFNKKGR